MMSKKLALVFLGVSVLGFLMLLFLPGKKEILAQTAIFSHSCEFPFSCEWVPHPENPIVKPSLELESSNIYAPDVHFEDGIYKMWYGGQARDTDFDDRIFYATSNDGIHWQKQGMVLDTGSDEHHVNDPSVVKVGNTYYMYYTSHEKDKGDRIHLAISQDGTHWQKKGRVVNVTSDNWDSKQVSRPSVLYEDGIFKLWYDGISKSAKTRSVGYATSTDGYHWTKYSNNPVFAVANPGAVDVEHIGNYYVMVYESRLGTRWALGDDEVTWEAKGFLFRISGQSYDAYGHVTPMIFLDKNGRWVATYYGPATHNCWCHNRIGVSLVASSPRCQSSADDILADFETRVDPRWQVKCRGDDSYQAPTIKYYQDRNFWDVKNDGDEKNGYCDVWLDLGGEDWRSCQKLLLDWAASGNPNGARVRIWLMNKGQWNSPSLATLTTEGSGWERQKEVLLDLSGQSKDKVERLMFRVKENWIPPGETQRTGLYNLSLSQCSVYDFNQDCVLNSQDLKILLSNWGASRGGTAPLRGDLNLDDKVNGVDFGVMLKLIR